LRSARLPRSVRLPAIRDRRGRPLGITISAPVIACDRALLGGVRRNQARIDGKAFAANQTGRETCLDNPFEHTTKNLDLAEALVAARENTE
jgi:hypothetical protein